MPPVVTELYLVGPEIATVAPFWRQPGRICALVDARRARREGLADRLLAERGLDHRAVVGRVGLAHQGVGTIDRCGFGRTIATVPAAASGM